MSNIDMDCVEKMLTRYIEKTVRGVRADYFRKAMKQYNTELSIDAISDTDEIIISQPKAGCGECAGCPNNKLCQALDELPERQAFIISKKFVEKYTEKEIAEMLGITQQAVHFHKNKALRKLYDLLSDGKIVKPY